MRIFRDGFPFNKARYCNRRKKRDLVRKRRRKKKKKVEFA